jgi:hypothetical protein
MASRPPRTERAARLVAGALVAAAHGIGAQPASRSFAAADVSVSVSVSPLGVAAVSERFAMGGGAPAADFQFLAVPCAIVGAVRMTLAGREIPLARGERPPWVVLHDSAGASRATAADTLEVSYAVRLTGREVGVPIVHPALPLRATAGSAGSAAGMVHLSVAFADSAGARVLLPQLRAIGGGAWTGRFLAMPSVVRLDRGPRPSAGSCAEPAAPAGDSGRFEFIFFCFLATIALWVPLYMWWVSRQQDSAGRRGR